MGWFRCVLRKRGWLLIVAVVVAVAFTLLSRTAGQKLAVPADSGATETLPNTDTAAAETPEPPPSPQPPPVGPDQPNFEISALQPGQQPPQFVIFSFDGAGGYDKWMQFMQVADEVNARFTGFLSGVYLLDDDHAGAYTGPGHNPGASSIGFGGTPDTVKQLIDTLNTAYSKGYEIGTHYNGHFCSGNNPSGANWSAADWKSELNQFFYFLTNTVEINGYTDAPALQIPVSAIQGGRTQCLEGTPDTVFPALEAHSMSYDTSEVGQAIDWPKKIGNIWEFYMPWVTVPATGKANIAMDYNFWYAFNKAKEEPGRAPEFSQMVLDTYRSMYDAAFNGNRAPLVIGNHFNNWSGNAFNPAALSFMQEVCTKPDTVCTTYQNVIKWMNAQDPTVLAELLARPPTAN